MIIRGDLKSGAKKASKSTQTAILRAGGRNPYGEPMYRLILAQDRITRAAGEWTIWGDNVSLDDRGGLGMNDVQRMMAQFQEVVQAAIQRGLPRHEVEKIARSLSGGIDEMLKSKLAAAPLAVERGMKEIELYPFEGWIIEKWKPAESFGSSADWEDYRFQGENALGPYPSTGEYELVAGPTPHLPTAGQCEDAIRNDYRQIQSRPKSARERVILLMQKVEERKKQQAKAERDAAEAFRKDSGALMNRLSLGAGRVRQAMADKAGLTGHYGN